MAAQQAAEEQAREAGAAVRKMESAQRAAVRARTVSAHDAIARIWVAFFSRCQRYRCGQEQSAKEWQERRTPSKGGNGSAQHSGAPPPPPGSARARRHMKSAADGHAEEEAGGSEPQRKSKAALPAFKVVQAAVVRARPSHTAAQIGTLHAGSVVTPLEKNWSAASMHSRPSVPSHCSNGCRVARGLKGETWLRCECDAAEPGSSPDTAGKSSCARIQPAAA